MSNHEITFNTKLSEPPRTRADFTYKISPTVISIVDTGLGSRAVTEDIEAVFRQIEYLHQGSISSFKIMYRDGKRSWNAVQYQAYHYSSPFHLRWAIEEAAQIKGKVGLNSAKYAPGWGWHRHITLAMVAHAQPQPDFGHALCRNIREKVTRMR